MTIAGVERETYEKMWSVPEYAAESPGVIFLPAFLEMAKPDPTYQSVCDAGCGAGAGSEALRDAGFLVYGADIVDVRRDRTVQRSFSQVPLWKLRSRADWIYCCDVLEHIPEEFTMLGAARLLDAACRGVFLSICLQADNFGALVGESLHKTVRPFTWWRDRLGELGTIVECRDLLSNGLYLVRR